MGSVPKSMVLFFALSIVAFYFISIIRYQILLSESFEPLLTQLQKPYVYHNDTKVVVTSTSDWKDLSKKNKESHGIDKKVPPPWSHPLIHIVTTRFMQEQGDLTYLTRARFELFNAICFPSMVNQEFDYLGTDTTTAGATNTNDPNIIWIIETDPQLEIVTKKRLISLLEPHPNFFLIGFNGNIKTWRNETMLQDMLNSEIYTGDRTILIRAYKERSTNILLETRLDADDGLHRIYLQSMQRNALRTLARIKRPTWAAWCPLKNFEWYNDSRGSLLLSKLGGMKPVFNSQACITAGLTIASSPRVQPKKLEFQHQHLFQYGRSKGCGLSDKIKCVKMVSHPTVSAIRARTTTSAGMKDVGLISKDQKDIAFHPRVKNQVSILRENERRYSMLLSNFGIDGEHLVKVVSYFEANALGIATDNLRGQCTRGHSCKDSSKAKLQKIIQEIIESTKTVT